MANLSSGLSIGSASASSLLKSASSLSAQIASYQDSLQAFEYSNSAFTGDAYISYKNYLQGRIDSLNSAGGITNAQKALTLTKTLESATHQNTSAEIQRENIQVLSGNATLQDKYGVVVDQYQRAMSNGDLTLAQSLESQAYSISQSIQYQAQQAASARDTLAKAAASAQQGNVTYQSEVVTNLTDALKGFEGIAKNASEKQLNSTLKNFVTSNADTFKSLGVNISTAQPNYWDVVSGVAGAVYNHKVLQAQAEAPLNPLLSRTYAQQAQDYLTGTTKFQTLGGSLSMQQVQQASQDPSMFAYDSNSGTYKQTIQNGYQYMSFQDQNGQPYQALVPQYSGQTQRSNYNKVYFLTPNETATMTKLGLSFTKNSNDTTGNGVQVQLTQNSPDWLKSVLGENGVTNFFTDPQGNLVFKGASGSGSGFSYYTLSTDAKGLSGLYEHTMDGTTKLAGGAYGFNAGAAQLLINQGQQVQQQISLNQAAQAAAAKAASISLARQTAPQSIPLAHPAPQNITVPRPTPQPIAPRIVNPQPASTTQVQQPAATPQAPGGFNLQGGGGIRLQ